MSFPRTIREGLAVRTAGTPGQWAAAAVYGDWVALKGVGRRAALIALAGELDGDMTVEVFEATDSSGTSAQELTGVTTGETFANGTDEGNCGIIEVQQDDLSAGFSHIAVRCTPATADGFAAAWVISQLYEYPAANAAANGVTFSTGSDA